jgi:hypothetical protein
MRCPLLLLLLPMAPVACGGEVATKDAPPGLVAPGPDAGANAEPEAGPVCDGGRCTVTIASGLPAPSYLAVDSTSVYWANIPTGPAIAQGSSVMKAPIGGGAVRTLASGLAQINALTVDATSVYWTTNDTVAKAPLGGGTPTQIGAANEALGIAVDSSNAYFLENNGQAPASLDRVPLAGGTPAPVATVPLPMQGIALDNTNIYWIDYPQDGAGGVTGNVMKMPKAGGPQTVLATGGRMGGIALDATSVYWVDFDANAVRTVPIDGGDPVTLASATSIGAFIAVDSTSVYYWVTADRNDAAVPASLTKVPIAGGTPTTLASGVYGPFDIAVSSTSVFWTAWGPSNGVPGASADGAVMQLTPK